MMKILKKNYVLIALVLASSPYSLADNHLNPIEVVSEDILTKKIISVDEIESITVTAKKRKQSLQHIPITINALNKQDIVDLGVIDMENILTLFPNLSSNATTELAVGFSIRGVGTNNPHGNVNQAVGIYRDEISYGSPYSGILGVYDTERIEVLRGPQNSLFGRNTIGGAVHYISTKPNVGDVHSTGYMLADVGSFNMLNLTAAINVPLSENTAVRVSGQSVQRDGIYNNLATNSSGQPLGENDLGDKDRQSARVQVLWQPTEYTELLINYHYAKHDGTNIGNRAFGTRDENDPYLLINGVQDFKDNSIPDDKATISPFINNVDANNESTVNSVDRNGFNPSTGNWHQMYNVSSARSYADINGGFIKFTYQFDNKFNLQITSSFDDTELETADETSGTNSLQFIPHRDAVYEQQSHELRILSPEDQKVRWLIGAYYFKEDMDLYTIVRRFNYIGAESNVPRDVTAHNILFQEDKDLSIYGSFEWDLSQKFTLSSGVRYTENKKNADSRFGVTANYNTNPSGGGSISSMPFNTSTDLIFDRVPTDDFLDKTFIENCYSTEFSNCTVLPPSIKEYELEQNLYEWGGNIALDYQYSKDQLIYTSYARGFKSGGFDTRALAAFFGEGAEQAFLPEYLDSYEFGIKTQLNKSLQINSAFFYNIWEDLQTFGVFNGEPRYVNIPESKTKGIESEIKWIPKPTWFVQLGIGLLDTEITDNGSLSAADTGHELPNSPSFTFEKANSYRVRHINLTSRYSLFK